MSEHTLYTSLEDLKALIAQAESEHHDGALGIVRIALRDGGVAGALDIDMGNPLHERVLVG